MELFAANWYWFALGAGASFVMTILLARNVIQRESDVQYSESRVRLVYEESAPFSLRVLAMVLCAMVCFVLLVITIIAGLAELTKHCCFG